MKCAGEPAKLAAIPAEVWVTKKESTTALKTPQCFPEGKEASEPLSLTTLYTT